MDYYEKYIKYKKKYINLENLYIMKGGGSTNYRSKTT